MEWYSNLDGLEIDLSSYCNAGCPSCRRTHHLKHSEMDLIHFDVDTWKRLWTEDLKDIKINKLVLNGNWGDPGMHKHLVEMLKYPPMHNPNLVLQMDTNGGMRNTQFWHDLAKVLEDNYHASTVRFGIDGITNFTNDIYRVDVSYDKVIENAQAFIDGGGFAQWRMTVFDHNVKQIQDAKDIAHDMDFTTFRARKSYARIIYDYDDNIRATTYCYDSMDHKKIFFEEKFMSTAMQKRWNRGRRGYQQPPLLDSKCPWYRERRLQIDPWTNVWACCHISGELLNRKNEDGFEILQDSWNKYGFKFNSLKNGSLQKILENDYFKKEIDHAIDEKKWSPCRKMCNV